MAGQAVLYEQFARIGKALASPRRVELLDVLCQGGRSVEALARAASMTLTNTSQHLQVLRAARLVDARREGTRVVYEVADDDVCRLFIGLRAFAGAHLAEVEQVVRRYLGGGEGLEPISRLQLLSRIERNDVLVLDVRPSDEFVAGHIPGATSIPIDELEERLRTLPHNREIVAYCRGPYCLLAPRAVELLREHGFQARRLEDGLPEWRLEGLPVGVGDEQKG